MQAISKVKANNTEKKTIAAFWNVHFCFGRHGFVTKLQMGKPIWLTHARYSVSFSE